MRPQIFRQFSDDIFCRHPQKRLFLVLVLQQIQQIHLYGPLYLAQSCPVFDVISPTSS